MNAERALSFGHLLRRYRRAAGLTQEALAERAALSVFTISALERGANQSPHKDTLVLLAGALGLTLTERATLEAAARGRGAMTAARTPVGASAVAPLVGREHELALLERHLAGEGPPVLLLAGEPGIGKSRLLREAMRLAISAGLEVLHGGCRQLGGQEPYAPFPDALRGYVRGQGPGRLRAEFAGCAWLVRLLPELATGPIPPLPAWTLAPEQERHLTFEAAARFLANIAGPAGLLLLLDDLQWAGHDALDLLRALAEAAGAMQVRLVAAYRDTAVCSEDALSTLLADLARTGLATHHKLTPLESAQTARLLDLMLAGREDVEAPLRERIVERSGGVPFFAVSCVEGLQPASSPVNEAAPSPAHDEVPWTVAQSVRQRVAMLPPQAQELLRQAAVVGRVAPRALLVALASSAASEVLDALDAACQAGLLAEYGAGAYRFAHDIVREVVEADLSTARRAALHQRVADVLETLPGPRQIEELAYHYTQSDDLDKAALYLEHAGDQALARSAFGAAESYYRDAAQRLEALGRQRDVAHAYAKLGLLLEQISNAAECISALQCATAAFARSRGTWTPVQGSASPGDLHTAEDVRAELYLAGAALALYQDRFSDCMALAQRAAEVACAAGDAALHARALCVQGNAQLKSGRLDEAVTTLGEARRLCEEMGALGLLDIVLHVLVFVHELRGDFAEAERCNAQCLAYAETIGDRALTATAAFRRAGLEIDTGEWERAHADLDLAAQLAPRFAQDAYVVACHGYISMLQGAWDDAASLLAEALNRAAGMGDMSARVMVERWLAELALLQGQPAAALARLRTMLDLDEVHDTVFMLPLVAWAHLQLGDLDAAEAVSRQAVARAHAEQTMLALPDALGVQALAAIERRRWTEVEQALDEGLALTRRMPYPYAEARLLAAYGRLRLREGEYAAARERLEQALAIFGRLGARKDVERVQQMLANQAQMRR